MNSAALPLTLERKMSRSSNDASTNGASSGSASGMNGSSTAAKKNSQERNSSVGSSNNGRFQFVKVEARKGYKWVKKQQNIHRPHHPTPNTAKRHDTRNNDAAGGTRSSPSSGMSPTAPSPTTAGSPRTPTFLNSNPSYQQKPARDPRLILRPDISFGGGELVLSDIASRPIVEETRIFQMQFGEKYRVNLPSLTASTVMSVGSADEESGEMSRSRRVGLIGTIREQVVRRRAVEGSGASMTAVSVGLKRMEDDSGSISSSSESSFATARSQSNGGGGESTGNRSGRLQGSPKSGHGPKRIPFIQRNQTPRPLQQGSSSTNTQKGVLPIKVETRIDPEFEPASVVTTQKSRTIALKRPDPVAGIEDGVVDLIDLSDASTSEGENLGSVGSAKSTADRERTVVCKNVVVVGCESLI